jgi:galactose oxidase
MLVRLSSATHAFDLNQRGNRLNFSAGTGSLAVTTPLNSKLAPPGHYMLFSVDAKGVPSQSKVVRFN